MSRCAQTFYIEISRHDHRAGYHLIRSDVIHN